MLRTIAGLEQAQRLGEIRIGDRRVNDVAPKDRDIAMVFQSYALYPQMDVARTWDFSLPFAKKSRHKSAERVRGASEDWGSTLLERCQAAFRRAASARRDGPRHRART